MVSPGLTVLPIAVEETFSATTSCILATRLAVFAVIFAVVRFCGRTIPNREWLNRYRLSLT